MGYGFARASMRADMNLAGRVAHRGAQIGRVALGAGLGLAGLAGIQAPIAFATQSGQKFLQLDQTLTQLRARFGEASTEAMRFGQGLGYTMERAAGLQEVIGRSVDQLRPSTFRAQLQFARITGQSGRAAVSGLSGIQRYIGDTPADHMAMVLGAARHLGMGEGRLPELQDVVRRSLERRLDMGLVDSSKPYESLAGALSTAVLPRMVFGRADERSRGGKGESFTQGIHRMLTKSGAMRSTLIRSLGFGRVGNDMSYAELEMQLERGIEDPRNLLALTGDLARRGYDTPDRMFRALYPEAKAVGMSATNTFALAEMMADPVRRKAFELRDGQTTSEIFRGELSPEERTAFDTGDLQALATRNVSGAEFRNVELERIQMAVGEPISKVMVGLTAMGGSAIEILGEILGELRKPAAEREWQLDGGASVDYLKRSVYDSVREAFMNSLGPSTRLAPAGNTQ